MLAWGSLTDIAQALHDDPGIAGKIRIHYIGSSNTMNDPASRDYVYDGMSDRWPHLWWIENGILPKLSRDTFRGVYQGGEQSGEWSNMRFIEANIRGHGSTHDGLFAERCGDVFPVATWPAGSLKEGDSPTMLYLLSPELGGVGDVDDPTQPNWGGQYHRPDPQRFPNYYTDLDADAATCQATISRWRTAYLSDWKARWDWYRRLTPAQEDLLLPGVSNAVSAPGSYLLGWAEKNRLRPAAANAILDRVGSIDVTTSFLLRSPGRRAIVLGREKKR